MMTEPKEEPTLRKVKSSSISEMALFGSISSNLINYKKSHFSLFFCKTIWPDCDCQIANKAILELFEFEKMKLVILICFWFLLALLLSAVVRNFKEN